MTEFDWDGDRHLAQSLGNRYLRNAFHVPHRTSGVENPGVISG